MRLVLRAGLLLVVSACSTKVAEVPPDAGVTVQPEVDVGSPPCETGCPSGTACVGVVCPGGEQCSNGACVPDQCGGTACPTGFVCSADSCTLPGCVGVTCGAGTVCASDGTCISTTCLGVQCGRFQICVNGSCEQSACVGVTCPDGLGCVGGSCVATTCAGVNCPAGTVCLSGACVPPTCAGIACGAANVCAGGRCVSRDCAGSQCAALTYCAGTGCSPTSCAGISCPSGSSCALGQCQPNSCGATACGAGRVCVSGACVEILCAGLTCATGGSCSGGTCRCPAGQMDCNGVCTDVSADVNNCAGCGRVCNAGDVCLASACVRDYEWSRWTAPADAPAVTRYTLATATATDTVTGLMWERESASTTYTWAAAKSYCDALGLGGFSDWRMPTLIELESIVNHEKFNPAIDITVFPGTAPNGHWSSSPLASVASYAWVVHFNVGYTYGNDTTLTTSHLVRCVR